MFDAQTVGFYVSTCECVCVPWSSCCFSTAFQHLDCIFHLGSRQIAREDVAATLRETAILHEPQDCFELRAKWTLRAELETGSKRVSPNGPFAQKWTLECVWSWNAARDDLMKGRYFKVSETVANTSTVLTRPGYFVVRFFINWAKVSRMCLRFCRSPM